MKFKLSTAGFRYHVSDKNIEILKKLGFTFAQLKGLPYEPNPKEWLHIEGEPEIEINSLEELLELGDKMAASLVVDRGEITIYDG